MESDEGKDFFVSYNNADREWAEWIAWTLEEAGYSTILEAWDFRPGSNFVLEMQKAAQKADRLIAVLSPDYLAAGFPQPEWASAFAGDPQGLERRLVPVIVRQCDPSGLLATVVQIRLYDMDSERARETLIAGVDPGRAKPLTQPVFPGGALSVRDAGEAAARSQSKSLQLSWTPLPSPPAVHWRADISTLLLDGPSAVELHLIPIEAVRIEVRKLAIIVDQLIALGRSRGMFSTTEALDRGHAEATALVRSEAGRRDASHSGLYVTRDGQVSGWVALPRDYLGSVLDPDDIRARLQALLETLVAVDVPRSGKVAIACGIEPADTLTSGRASDVGHRSQVTLPLMGRGPLRLLPDDALAVELLSQSGSIAEEIAARLVARFTAAVRGRT
jgi:TIR domain